MPDSGMLGPGINNVQQSNMKTHLTQQQIKTKIISHILHICCLWRLAQEGSRVKIHLYVAVIQVYILGIRQKFITLPGEPCCSSDTGNWHSQSIVPQLSP